MNSMLKNIMITITFCSSVGVAQVSESPISSDLRLKMSQTDDTTLIPVLIFFKGHKSWTESEQTSLELMTEDQRATYILRGIKSFSSNQEPIVKSILSEAEKSKQAKGFFALWAAYGISCSASKSVIEDISKVTEVREIKYDKMLPQEDILDFKHAGVMNYPNGLLSSVAPEWPVVQVNANNAWDLGYKGDGVLVAIGLHP